MKKRYDVVCLQDTYVAKKKKNASEAWEKINGEKNYCLVNTRPIVPESSYV